MPEVDSRECPRCGMEVEIVNQPLSVTGRFRACYEMHVGDDEFGFCDMSLEPLKEED